MGDEAGKSRVVEVRGRRLLWRLRVTAAIREDQQMGNAGFDVQKLKPLKPVLDACAASGIPMLASYAALASSTIDEKDKALTDEKLDELRKSLRTIAEELPKVSEEALEAAGITAEQVLEWTCALDGISGALSGLGKGHDRIEEKVDCILARLNEESAGLTDEDRAALLQRYREHLLGSPMLQYVESAGIASLQKIVSLKLEDAYVELEFLRRDGMPKADPELREMLERLDSGDVKDEERAEIQQRLGEREMRTSGEGRRLGAGQVLRDARHAVILGDPGAGKSTLVRYLAQTYARGAETIEKRLGLREDLVPVAVSAAGFAAARQGKNGLKLWEYIAEEVAATECEDWRKEAVKKAVIGELEGERAIVLIDGLDEIPDATERTNVAKCVGELLGRFGGCRIVVTSRIVGYEQCRLAGPEHYEVATFSDEQIREFARRWWIAFERAQHAEAADEAEAERKGNELADAILANNDVHDLSRNPLMISLVALIQHQEGSLPHRRVELYDRALRMLVETWNTQRSLAAVELGVPEGEQFDYYDTCEILAPIAYWMHETQPTGGVHEADLRVKLEAQLRDRDDDGRSVAATAESFIRAAGDHAGLLRERGPGRWAFFHQTFQEYLAAQHMARDPFGMAGAIEERIDDARWREVIQLAVSYVGVIQRQPQGATRVLAGLLTCGDEQIRDEHSLERATYRHLFLVADCLGDRPRVSAKVEKGVVRRLEGGAGTARTCRCGRACV